jgi:DNA replication and repair protein RecF
MFLRKLSLINFKNYSQAEIFTDSGVNAFVGGNGEGKTNLLDAIHYLSICKSYFNAIDIQNIKKEEEFFVVQGIFELNDVEENISCSFKRGQKKVFRRNQKEYDRLADHVGMLPVVMISPVDGILISGGSEERRKFIDSIISQFDRKYLEDLIGYTRIIMQRNAYLKQLSKSSSPDHETLSIWDDQLISLGKNIHAARLEFIEGLIPVFRYYYDFLSGRKETVELIYDSQLNTEDFHALLQRAEEKDRFLQYTTVGPHKDDLIFLINNMPVKRFASQGQQKSFLIALKLAQFEYISRKKGLKPILLLDDIFEKLDDFRVSKLMELVSTNNFGQIFITDTHAERLLEIFRKIGVEIRSFPVKDGEVVVNSLIN